MRLVVDASVAIKWFLPEELADEALALLEGKHKFIAPDLLMAEVGNILWKRVYRDETELADAKVIIKKLRALHLDIRPIGDLVEAALEIGNEFGTTVYDATYLALALKEEAIVVTADRKFHGKISNGELASSIMLLETLKETEGDPGDETG